MNLAVNPRMLLANRYSFKNVTLLDGTYQHD
jgi:hypothetical protein